MVKASTKREIFRLLKIFGIIFGIMGIILIWMFYRDRQWTNECSLRGGHSYKGTHICVNEDDPHAKYIIEW